MPTHINFTLKSANGANRFASAAANNNPYGIPSHSRITSAQSAGTGANSTTFYDSSLDNTATGPIKEIQRLAQAARAAAIQSQIDSTIAELRTLQQKTIDAQREYQNLIPQYSILSNNPYKSITAPYFVPADIATSRYEQSCLIEEARATMAAETLLNAAGREKMDWILSNWEVAEEWEVMKIGGERMRRAWLERWLEESGVAEEELAGFFADGERMVRPWDGVGEDGEESEWTAWMKGRRDRAARGFNW